MASPDEQLLIYKQNLRQGLKVVDKSLQETKAVYNPIYGTLVAV